ncbi:T-complex protein 1 subunit theta-like isoform X2 [Alosa sapidissima]|nr:T-complex protein 1 subunit theta-like isoform X2 [Alosa sapidissima]XP_041925549.1 T-complex protein 1 subunit theta-like isoform X2 [Alosa sapidissima]XP_041925550.1 T-complex protein 1 subunit theta-like isoform X2 [Alosa sapidissima]
MLLLRHLPDSSLPRITPLIWADPPARDPSALQVDACLEVARRLRPCFGPRGLPKPLAFRFLHGLTTPPVHAPDTASVLGHMELEDPAPRALASAAIAQAGEVGDGAGMVLLLGASLLEQAQVLLALGLTVQEVEEGYRLACRWALEVLDGGELVRSALEDPREERQVAGVLRVLLSTRVPEMADMLAEAVARCCVQSWTENRQGLVTFEPDAIQITKTISEGPSDQTSEELQQCPKEESEEESKGENVDERKEVANSTRQKVQGELEGDTEAEEEGDWVAFEEEGDWVAFSADKKEDKPKRAWESGIVGVSAGVTEGQDRKQQLIDGFLCDYVGLRHSEKVPSKRAYERSAGVSHELEPDEEDWEILSLALEDVHLEGEEGEDAGQGLGRWQTEEVNLLERLRAQEDGQERERRRRRRRRGETMRWAGGVGGAVLRKSTAACKRLFKGLVRLGRKYLAPRGWGRHTAGVQKHGRKLHRLTGKLRGPGGAYGKRQRPAKNARVAKLDPQAARPVQASIASRDAAGEPSQQSVTITLHSPDRDLLDRCESAIRACLRLYGAMLSDPRLVSGAGAAEAALSVRLCECGLRLPGLEQMAVHGFAQALLAPARVLGENSGTPADMAVTRLHEALRQRCPRRKGPHERPDEEDGDLLEPLVCKSSALKKATTAVLSIMSDLHSKTPGEKRTDSESPEFSPAPEPGNQPFQQS